MTAESGGKLSPAEVAEIVRASLDIPFHHFLDLEVVSCREGEAIVRFLSGPNTLNYAGMVHGGITYAVLDVACYMALAPLLKRGENAVTHDIHVSVLRPIPADRQVELRGRVLQRGRGVVFCRAEAWVDDKLSATASVTKSLVRLSRPPA